jgi:hypothetical protein
METSFWETLRTIYYSFVEEIEFNLRLDQNV